ncbi:hypothetical protein, partial [Streptomyces sp. NPDC058964]|uniref:hypothetical protein n=1 Tax=Streptomyces sp. NPDC058964 TaxID=3346681 RepID=UPI0036C583A6
AGRGAGAPPPPPGRRALQLALLLGGLLALGFLCGQQAHAADGTPPVTPVASAPPASADPVRAVPRKLPAKSVVEAVTAPVAPVAAPVAAPVEHAGDRAVAAVAPLDRGAAGSVTRRAVRPVGDLAGAVTQRLDEARGRLPALPATPSLPKLPKLPELPGLSEPPGRLLPAPVHSGPGTKQPGTARPLSGHGIRGATARTAADATATGAYGPAPAPEPGPVAHLAAPRADAPGRPAPPGDQDGAPGRPAVDSDSSRHGGAHAVTPNDRAPLRLAPGAAAHVEAAGTRDGHPDIPVFPG